MMEMVAGSAAGLARADVALTAGQGVASVMPINDSFDDVVAYPASELGNCQALVEWLGTPISLDPGQLDSTPISLAWSAAQHGVLVEPRCDLSGNAGTTVKMKLWGWPSGETV